MYIWVPNIFLMRAGNRLFQLLDINSRNLADVSSRIGIAADILKYYDRSNILPSESDLQKINKGLGIAPVQVMAAMGIVNTDILNALMAHWKEVADWIPEPAAVKTKKLVPAFTTRKGSLYQGDCIELMNQLKPSSVDLIFADPPFNLDKQYASGIDDNLASEIYLQWCEKWLDGCINILKPGGSLFIWNLPKWNVPIAEYLSKRLTFKNWIANDIKFSLPIQGRLYPSHYSLLYFVKGDKANSFGPDRMPMDVCRNCYKEIKDYGGYKNKMNPLGINISDVWTDIPPVRHSKYKKRKEANELSLKLMDRIIEMSSKPGDTVFDPFGGSGVSYIAAELKQRKWIGVEIGPLDSIIERFGNIEEERGYLEQIRDKYNVLFTEEVVKKRKERGWWTTDTFKDQNI
jgi:site-specific DNA-methyltransferase (adenine-specific)